MKKIFWGLIIVIAIIAIIAIIVFMLQGKSGLGKGSGGNDENAIINREPISASQEVEDVQPVTEEILVVNVRVSENDYLYNNEKYELDRLIDELLKADSSITVMITDDFASKNAYEKLEKALKENNIKTVKSDSSK